MTSGELLDIAEALATGVDLADYVDWNAVLNFRRDLANLSCPLFIDRYDFGELG